MPDHHASRAYDQLAARYDTSEEENRLLRRGRAHSLRVLRKHLPQRGRLFELGCGTAKEAIELARAGASVLASEPSKEMSRLAAEKVRETGVDVEVVNATAGEALARMRESGERFKGGWASFSLAYDAPLHLLRTPLSRVLDPGAPFIFSVPNPWTLSAPWRVPLRVLGLYRHKVGGSRTRLNCASARQARKALGPEFTVGTIEAMSVIVPPARFHRAWELLGPVARGMESLDEKLSPRFPWKHLGDHTVMVFHRSGSDAPTQGAPMSIVGDRRANLHNLGDPLSNR